MKRKKIVGERFDWTLAFLIILLATISCIAIYSGQSHGQYYGNFVIGQLKNYAIGVFIIAIVMYFDMDQIKRLTWFLYIVGILLMIGLFALPESIVPERKGAKLWYVIPVLGQIQPSEFVKIFIIITLAKVIADHHKKHMIKTIQSDFLLLMKLSIATFVPLALIIIRDLGTGLVVIAIFLGMVVISGITWKILLPIATLGTVTAGSLIYLVLMAPQVLEKYLGIEQYQFYRIYSWLDPITYKQGSGLQLYKSLQAIGSGLLTGKGFYNREVYIPDAHTDFIFSVIGEEYGFIGSCFVLLVFFFLIYHLIQVALSSTDPFNSYICVGIISMITFHVFQNVGMTIQVLPITGIPLPFISYGGSSLMGNMFAMGLIFSIKFHQKKSMFSTDKEIVSKQ